MESNSFLEAFVREICVNFLNDYDDNYDFYRFGQLAVPADNQKFSWKAFVKQKLRQKGYGYVAALSDQLAASIHNLEPFFAGLQTLYEQMDDQTSKELLVQLMAYRCLGHKKVKLPLNTPTYWQNIQNIEKLVDYQEFCQTRFQNWKLYKINLESLNYPIQFFYSAQGVYTQFVLQQYRGVADGLVVEAESGDYVIDAGGCWGDTALYFADKVGPTGKVFTYEFIPSNLEILLENLSLNLTHEKRVQIVDKAVWRDSDKTLFYKDNGPASLVDFQAMPDATGQVATLSIDDLVVRHSIDRLDFIKMDIEGAELSALQGSVCVLRRFKPKLAISVYHHLSHFYEIPDFITSLGLGYKFFLRHYTIHREETILFAWSDQR